MRLKPNQKKVLSVLHMEADLPLERVCEVTGLRIHAVRYALKRLKEQQLILRSPIIDVYKLGFTHYGVFFSLAIEDKKKHQQLISSLVASDKVSFVCELGGEFHYAVSFCARDLFQLAYFLDDLSEKYGNVFYERAVAARLALHDYPIKSLFGVPRKVSVLGWGVSEEIFEYDQIDHSILKGLSSWPEASKYELSDRLKIPFSTFDFRLKKLEEKKVIVGYRYFVNTEKLGIQSYLILIYLKSMRQRLKNRINSFCSVHPHVRFLVENLGGWDYEICVEVSDPKTVTGIVREINEEFGSSLNTVKVLPIFDYLKVSNYPFKKYPL